MPGTIRADRHGPGCRIAVAYRTVAIAIAGLDLGVVLDGYWATTRVGPHILSALLISQAVPETYPEIPLLPSHNCRTLPALSAIAKCV